MTVTVRPFPAFSTQLEKDEMPVMKIQNWHLGNKIGGAVFYPNGGGYRSVRHLQVSLLWRWRRHPRERFERTKTGVAVYRKDNGNLIQTVDWLNEGF